MLNYLEKRRKEENVESIKDLVRKESAAEVGCDVSFGILLNRSGDFCV